MGRLWCMVDPKVTVNGKVFRVELQLQKAHIEKLRQAPTIEVLVPVGSTVEIEPIEGLPAMIEQWEVLVESEESNELVDTARFSAGINKVSGNVNTRLSVWEGTIDGQPTHIQEGPAKRNSITVSVPAP